MRLWAQIHRHETDKDRLIESKLRISSYAGSYSVGESADDKMKFHSITLDFFVAQEWI